MLGATAQSPTSGRLKGSAKASKFVDDEMAGLQKSSHNFASIEERLPGMSQGMRCDSVEAFMYVQLRGSSEVAIASARIPKLVCNVFWFQIAQVVL